MAPGRGSLTSRVLLEGKSVHIIDVLADPEYTMLETQKKGGHRTVLGVPLLREGVPIGVLHRTRISRMDANPVDSDRATDAYWANRSRRTHHSHPRCARRPRIYLDRVDQAGRLANFAGRSAAARGNSHRGHRAKPLHSSPVH